MRVDLFDFDLPRAAIADRPASPRDSARLLVVDPACGLADRGVRDLPGCLAPGDVLVVNDTRVIPARLTGQVGQGKVEITLHKAVDPACWWAFAKPARKLTPGRAILFSADPRLSPPAPSAASPDPIAPALTAPALTATVVERGEGGEVLVRFDRAGAALRAALEAVGQMPLPPYISRATEASDRVDYQTMFAAADGAVAAPTAGLHFTPSLLEALAARGVGRETLTLHVGAGTFLPVKADDTRDHRMHAEHGHLTPAVAERLNAARAAGGRLVAVGTTALRLLESAADETGRLHPFCGETDIFITPGYRFRAVDLLMTNFHLPRSTLFMLVSAFAGLERMQAAYAHAIAAGYRFYSYGDACLLHPDPGDHGAARSGKSVP